MQTDTFRYEEQMLLKQNIERRALAMEITLLKQQLFASQHQNAKQKADFFIRSSDLMCQNYKQQKHANELYLLNVELMQSSETQKRHVEDLERMLQIISHKVRQPIAHILGLSELLSNAKASKAVKVMIGYLKDSALSLDSYTREFTKYIGSLIHKVKPK